MAATLPAFLLAFLLTHTVNAFYPGLHNYFDLSKVQKRQVSLEPDVFRNVSQLIASKGYPVQEYYVVTDDGFILSLQRIPYGRNGSKGKNKPVVMLQHGLLADAGCWVTLFPNTSLPFILADHGYDVWLTNTRGNRYSRRHKHLNPWNPLFWKWSFDAMAKYDLPANIDYILQVTGKKQLYYIGHSQGTLMAFAGFSTQPELAKKVKLFVALAPITSMAHITVTYLKDLAETVTALNLFAPIIDSAFLPGNVWRDVFIENGFCSGLTEEKLCYRIVEFVFGVDEKNVNFSRVPVTLNSFPSGSSFRNMVHFAQLVTTGKCQMFDYGRLENYAHYNQEEPPLYHFENITTPIALFSGSHDTLSDPKDVAALAPRIKNLVTNTVLQDWNHVDFLFSTDASKVLYPEIVKLLGKYEQL